MKGLVDDHLFRYGPIVQTLSEKSTLEGYEFALLLKQIAYDKKVYETWQKKCSTIYGARELARQEMKLNRRKKAIDNATLF